MNMNMETRLTHIFHEVFDRSDIVLKREMTADDIAQWDSLTHIRLIVAIEQEFNFHFSLAHYPQLHNVGAIMDIITDKMA